LAKLAINSYHGSGLVGAASAADYLWTGNMFPRKNQENN